MFSTGLPPNLHRTYIADTVMKSPGIWNAAEDEENFARCRRLKWLLKLVVFPFLAITIFRQRRHTHWPLFKGRPLASALRPKYIHTRDLPLDLAIRAMLARPVFCFFLPKSCKRATTTTSETPRQAHLMAHLMAHLPSTVDRPSSSPPALFFYDPFRGWLLGALLPPSEKQKLGSVVLKLHCGKPSTDIGKSFPRFLCLFCTLRVSVKYSILIILTRPLFCF